MRSSSLVGSSLLVLALATAATALGACSSPAANDDGVAEGRATRQTKKGAEFVRCWTTNDGAVDEDFRVYTLRCRVSSAGLHGLGKSGVSVDAKTVKSSVQSGTPGNTPDTDVVIGGFYRSDFPLSAMVYGYWNLGEFSTTDYRTDVAIADTATAEQPVIVKMPFDTWEVTLLNRLPVAAVSSDRYEVQAAPFVTDTSVGATKTTFQTSVQSGFLRDVPRKDLEVIVPQSGSVKLDLQGLRSPSSTTISGPGVYVLDQAGIRQATAAEEAEADNADAGPAPAADAGPATDAAPATDGGTDASTVSTTCGNAGQTYCRNAAGQASCNPGNRWDQSSGKCIACGEAGQTYCLIDPNNFMGNGRCNAGTRWDQSSNKCIACGQAGQTYCLIDPNNFMGNGRCNAGTRWDQSSSRCIACGTPGLTYCLNDPNNFQGSAICTAPATYNSSTYKCQ